MDLPGAFSILPAGRQLALMATLGLALLLSSAIGLERETRMKSAGLRTHTLVGVASCLIMLISKYGFEDVALRDQVIPDPSRVAAQIVSGIGFIGGGLIFVQRDIVRGLTTAATIWLAAAVGMACGAGLPLLAIGVVAIHFVIVYAYPPLERRLLRRDYVLDVHYAGEEDVLGEVLRRCRELGFEVGKVQQRGDLAGHPPQRALRVALQGSEAVDPLVAAVQDIGPAIRSAELVRRKGRHD